MPRPKLLQFLVAIVVITIFFVPAFVLAVALVPATAVPIALVVPVMVVLETPARTSPVANVVAALFIVRNDPDRAKIRRTRPVASVPVIVTVRRIPVAVDPHELVIFRFGAWRANGDHSGWRRCADLNAFEVVVDDKHLFRGCPQNVPHRGVVIVM